MLMMKFKTTISHGRNLFLKPSFWLRFMWIAVAALHAWLILCRCLNGHVESLTDISIVLLCVIAIWHASRKVWRIATIFDSKPRRAVIFALTLLFGHLAIQARGPVPAMAGPAEYPVAVQMIFITPVLFAAAVLLLLFSGKMLLHCSRRENRTFRSILNRIILRSIHARPQTFFSCYCLFDKPPPPFCSLTA
jgi:hypothetical protein